MYRVPYTMWTIGGREREVHLPYFDLEPTAGQTTYVWDACLVRRQTYGYLCVHTASVPFHESDANFYCLMTEAFTAAL